MFVNYLTEGQLFTYEEFLSEYKIPILPKEFAVVFDAVPSRIKYLFSFTNRPSPTIALQTTQTDLYIGNSDPFLSNKTNNKCIRELIHRDIISKPASVFVWSNVYPDIDWEKTWLLPRKFFVSNKVREVSLKILHRCYPVNLAVMKYMLNIDPLCSFCHLTDESITHLFWDCTFSQSFWNEINILLNRKLDIYFQITIECILFGLSDRGIPSNKLFIINLICLLAKFHIHTSKFAKQKPNLLVFASFLKSYLETLEYCTNLKAVKTRTLCKEFYL